MYINIVMIYNYTMFIPMPTNLRNILRDELIKLQF